VISALKWQWQLRVCYIFHCAALKNFGEAFELSKIEIEEKERSLWAESTELDNRSPDFLYEFCFGYTMIDEFRIS
jgi:hypothetical protein